MDADATTPFARAGATTFPRLTRIRGDDAQVLEVDCVKVGKTFGRHGCWRRKKIARWKTRLPVSLPYHPGTRFRFSSLPLSHREGARARARLSASY